MNAIPKRLHEYKAQIRTLNDMFKQRAIQLTLLCTLFLTTDSETRHGRLLLRWEYARSSSVYANQ